MALVCPFALRRSISRKIWIFFINRVCIVAARIAYPLYNSSFQNVNFERFVGFVSVSTLNIGFIHVPLHVSFSYFFVFIFPFCLWRCCLYCARKFFSFILALLFSGRKYDAFRFLVCVDGLPMRALCVCAVFEIVWKATDQNRYALHHHTVCWLVHFFSWVWSCVYSVRAKFTMSRHFRQLTSHIFGWLDE